MRYIRLSAMLLLIACGDGEPTAPPTPPTPVATSITLSASTLSFDSLSQVQQLTATVKDQNGATMSGASVSWAISDAAIATVSSTGLVTSVLNGSATVTATSGSANATAAVTVSATYLVVTVIGDGDPLPDVAVWLTDPTASDIKQYTDAKGGVLFRNLQAGEHAVTLQELPPGLTVTSPQTVQVSLNDAHDLVFDGIFAPAEITGTAKSWGTPVEGAVVRIEGKDTVEVTTDSVGVFQVDSVRRGGSGTYTFTIGDYTGVRFKEETLTQTLESGSNSIQFIGKPDPEPTWASLATGSRSTCGVTTEGVAYCWGSNGYGQLGNGSQENRSIPTLVAGGYTWASDTDGSGSQNCGVTTEGVAYCWGANGNGQLGNGTTTNSSVPVVVVGGHNWTLISSHGHTCGLTTSDLIYCWGLNSYGNLGDGTATHRTTPTRVSGGHTWTSVSAGWHHTCAIKSDAMAYCWGDRLQGQLGDSTSSREEQLTPTPVSGGHTWTSISSGGEHTCAIKSDAVAYCWGANGHGNLGDGTNIQRDAPSLVSGGHNWTSVNAGFTQACGVSIFSLAYCWGDNQRGQLGDGTTIQRDAPSLVSGGHTWASIAPGSGYTCGVTTAGEGYCWGRNDYGQLGDGTTSTHSYIPTKVGGNW